MTWICLSVIPYEMHVIALFSNLILCDFMSMISVLLTYKGLLYRELITQDLRGTNISEKNGSGHVPTMTLV